jgi:hypothetical protein
MNGAIPPLPNTPSQRGAQLKYRIRKQNTDSGIEAAGMKC